MTYIPHYNRELVVHPVLDLKTGTNGHFVYQSFSLPAYLRWYTFCDRICTSKCQTLGDQWVGWSWVQGTSTNVVCKKEWVRSARKREDGSGDDCAWGKAGETSVMRV